MGRDGGNSSGIAGMREGWPQTEGMVTLRWCPSQRGVPAHGDTSARPCPHGGHHEQDGPPLLVPSRTRLPGVEPSVPTGDLELRVGFFSWMGEMIFFFLFFTAFQARHRGRVSLVVPRLGLAAETVPAVPGPGAAFGNGRTHTGAVAGSGGSRLANYGPGAPPRTRPPASRQRPPALLGAARHPPNPQSSAAGLGGPRGVRAVSRSIRCGFGGM